MEKIFHCVVAETISCFIFVSQQKYFNYKHFQITVNTLCTPRETVCQVSKKKRKQPTHRALNSIESPTRRTSDHTE